MTLRNPLKERLDFRTSPPRESIYLGNGADINLQYPGPEFENSHS